MYEMKLHTRAWTISLSQDEVETGVSNQMIPTSISPLIYKWERKNEWKGYREKEGRRASSRWCKSELSGSK